MKAFIICAVAFMVLVLILCIADHIYYSKKLPKESLEEIDKKIADCDIKLQDEDDILKQSELLDIKEYWEQERKKLIDYNNKHGVKKGLL